MPGARNLSLPDKTVIWCLIRDSVRHMHREVRQPARACHLSPSSRAGVNSGGVLMWSQGRSVEEVTRHTVEIEIFLRGQNFKNLPFDHKG